MDSESNTHLLRKLVEEVQLIRADVQVIKSTLLALQPFQEAKHPDSSVKINDLNEKYNYLVDDDRIKAQETSTGERDNTGMSGKILDMELTNFNTDELNRKEENVQSQLNAAFNCNGTDQKIGPINNGTNLRSNEELQSAEPKPIEEFRCTGCNCTISPMSIVKSHLAQCFSRPEMARFVGKKIGIGLPHQKVLRPYLAAALKKHQLEGVSFLWKRLGGVVKRDELKGCILADAMGFGKTLTAVVLIMLLFQDGNLGQVECTLGTAFRVCVLCPATVMAHWAGELQRWLAPGDLPKIFLMHAAIYGEDRSVVFEEWGKTGGLLLLSYELYRNIAAEAARTAKGHLQPLSHRLLCYPGPDLLILDEGHRLRSELSQITLCLRSCKSPRRLVLSGYPLQNNLMEYWSMLDIAVPGVLGDAQAFRINFERPICKALQPGSKPQHLQFAAALMRALNTGLKDHVLRREYSAILQTGMFELPPKISIVLRVALSPLQEELYKRVSDFATALRWDPGSASLLLLEARHPLMLLIAHPWTLFQQLKQCRSKSQTMSQPAAEEDPFTEVGHGWFFEQHKKAGLKRYKIMEHLKELQVEGKLPTSNNHPDEEHGCKCSGKIKASRIHLDSSLRLESTDLSTVQVNFPMDVCLSGKLVVVLELLLEFKVSREKCLIFSQSLKTLDTLQHVLELHGFSGFIVRMDGHTPEVERQSLISTFQDQNSMASIFLISTKTGGEGINLTAASRVILFDTSFNPSCDAQASFRAYRYGQTKTVYVYRLLAAGTVEESLYNNQLYKMELSQSVVDGKIFEAMFSKESLQHALNYDAEAKSRPFYHDTNIAQNPGQHQGLSLNSFGDEYLEAVLQKLGGSTIVETLEQEDLFNGSHLNHIKFTEKQLELAFDLFYRLNERPKSKDSTVHSTTTPTVPENLATNERETPVLVAQHSAPVLQGAMPQTQRNFPQDVLARAAQRTPAAKSNAESKIVSVFAGAKIRAAPHWDEYSKKKRKVGVVIAQRNGEEPLQNKQIILSKLGPNASLTGNESKTSESEISVTAQDGIICEEMLTLPATSVSHVIGKKGRNIKKLEEISGTRMFFEENNNLIIQGENAVLVAKGREAVQEFLINQSSKRKNYPIPSSSSSMNHDTWTRKNQLTESPRNSQRAPQINKSTGKQLKWALSQTEVCNPFLPPNLIGGSIDSRFNYLTKEDVNASNTAAIFKFDKQYNNTDKTQQQSFKSATKYRATKILTVGESILPK